MAKNKLNLEGKSFGRWTVISRSHDLLWLCECSCGIMKEVNYQNLFHGVSKSCGCLHKELASAANKTHGDSKTRLYSIWSGIKKRILNKNDCEYHNYGGRGITICDDWLKYENFKNWAIPNGYKDDLSIERIDFNKNYCPKNCCWIPMSEQGLNRRGLVKYKGETQKRAGIRLGGSGTLVRDRIVKLGWPKKRAFTTYAA